MMDFDPYFYHKLIAILLIAVVGAILIGVGLGVCL